MFDATNLLALSICTLVGVALIVVCVRHFEVAVVLTFLSPWIASLFIPNTFQAEFYEGAGSFIRMGLLLLLGIAGIVYFLRGLPIEEFRLPAPFLLLAGFICLALLSASYSIDTRYTVIRAGAFVAVLLFLIGMYRWVVQSSGVGKTLDLLFRVCTGIILINAVSLALIPSKVWWWTAPNRFQGLAAHPNAMGSFLMLSYPILFWKFSSSGSKLQRMSIVALICLAAILHILTGSRATLLSAVVGTVVWLLVSKKTTILLLVSAVAGTFLLAGLMTAGVDSMTPESLSRGSGFSGITNLTGRPEFWAGSIFLINKRPLTGYGFAVEGRIWSDRRFLNRKLALWSGSAKTSLHNGYLSVAVGLGWVGLALWLLAALTPIWQLKGSKVDGYLALVLSIMSMCLMVNFVESAINGSRSITALTFWIMWTLAICLPRQGQTLIPRRS